MDARSEKNLTGVHPALAAVAHLAYARMTGELSFIVTEGLRTLERQRELVRTGASQTLKSKHLEGRAFDVAATINGRVHWDWPLYVTISGVMKEAAKELGVQIEWGGDWVSFPDGPHFQLAAQTYAA